MSRPSPRTKARNHLAPPKGRKRRYFSVRIERQYTGFFKLIIQRLHKRSENLRDGLSPIDQYLPCGEITGLSERDAQCVVMALESPRERLSPGEEELYWKDKLKGLTLQKDGTSKETARA